MDESENVDTTRKQRRAAVHDAYAVSFPYEAIEWLNVAEIKFTVPHGYPVVLFESNMQARILAFAYNHGFQPRGEA